jgi:formamidopyrimidine-DNA glycosylase
MPELPDVETFKGYLDATSLHRRIEKVEIDRDDILGDVSARSLQRRLKGRSLESTRRHGKYLFAKVSDDGWLVLHFGMTGYPTYSETEEPPAHTRVLFKFDGGGHLAYVCMRMLGRVDWTKDADRFIEQHKLGIDAQSEDFDFDRFQQLLETKRGSIKSALMDQQTIAGLGNIYVDEILFQARVHPKTSVSDLDDSQLKTIFQQISRVLKTAIRAQASREKMPKSFLLSQRGEEHAKCPRCGELLESIKVSGRTSYFCPMCQQTP